MNLSCKLAAAALCTGLGLSVSQVQADAPAAPWRVVEQKSGIVVSTRDQPGEPLPRLRAQGRIKGSVLDVLAVVLDDSRAHEWAKGSTETSRLRTIDERTNLIYTRSDQPWPVRDRDLVMKRVVDVLAPGEAFRLNMVCAEGAKPVTRGVVRVNDCQSTLVLRKVDAQTTAIDYQISLDPGGHLPEWVVTWASERVPFDTLVALEKQVAQTKGNYRAAVEFWSHAL